MEDVLREIRGDLAAFADPGSDMEVAEQGALWIQDGEEREVTFRLDRDASRHPRVAVAGHEMSYRDFLASPGMADLGKFARFTKNVVPRTSAHIHTTAVCGTDDPARQGRAGRTTDLLLSLATESLPFASTRVVFLQGEAGSGKTIALRELTVRQAARYEERKADRVFFYVNAQGRALSRIDDAIAKDLDDLRASFPYAAVAPLARHGLLIPIIDGFDELLGSGGYDEAFSSLAALISTLNRRGVLIASARSAFFDYRSFRENAQKFAHAGSLNYELQTLRVQPWDDAQQARFAAEVAEQRGRSTDATRESFVEARAKLSRPDQALLGKPFYLSKFVDLLLAGESFDEEGQLLDVVVNAFLEREHTILKAKEDVPLLSLKGHRAFLSELADEMWWQESRRVDIATLQAIADLIAEKFGLPPASASALVARVSSYPFLTTDKAGRNWYRFEHEVLYGYFLAHRLRDCLHGADADLRRFLNRAIADESLFSETARLVGGDVERVRTSIERLSSVLNASLSDVVGRHNAGALAAALVASCTGSLEGVEFNSLIFDRVSFGAAQLVRPRFSSCEFEGVDWRQVSLEHPVFENCAIRMPVIDLEMTRLSGPAEHILDQLHGVLIDGGHLEGVPLGETYQPDHVRMAVGKIGGNLQSGEVLAEQVPNDVSERLRIVDRFLRKMERRYFASEDDIKNFPFASGREWDRVWDLLERHDLIEPVFVTKSGSADPLFKLTVPPDILRRGESSRSDVPGRVRQFWAEVRE